MNNSAPLETLYNLCHFDCIPVDFMLVKRYNPTELTILTIKAHPKHPQV